MRRADADLLLAAHAGDFDAAEAALAAGAAVNCANQARGAAKLARSFADSLLLTVRGDGAALRREALRRQV
jgi:hypothetical protein